MTPLIETSMNCSNCSQVVVMPEDIFFTWARMYKYGCFLGSFLSIIGMVGNCLCFITAKHLPPSTSAFLMRYLALWDTVSAFQDGILHLGLRFFGVHLADMNVSLIFQKHPVLGILIVLPGFFGSFDFLARSWSDGSVKSANFQRFVTITALETRVHDLRAFEIRLGKYAFVTDSSERI